jgi:hypothetical protein
VHFFWGELRSLRDALFGASCARAQQGRCHHSRSLFA